MEPTNNGEDVRVLNRELFAALDAASDGPQTKLAAASGDFTRRVLRENGFMRAILPPKPITDEELDRTTDSSSLPIRIEDMEGSQPAAVSLPLNASSDATSYTEDRYVVRFECVQTRSFEKNINELRTQRMDLRAVVSDNALRDMQTQEDSSFMSLVETIVGSATGTGPYTGVVQNHTIDGAITRESYKEIVPILSDVQLPLGIALMNRRTASAFLGWDRLEIGGDKAERIFDQGLDALTEARIFGVRHLFTIKASIVPNNTVYLFAPPNFLGKFYELTPPTMYAEKKEEMLRWKAKEWIGVTIANALGIHKVTFSGG